MNFFDKFQNGLEKVVGPFATAVGKSKYIQALTEGFMYSMPLTLGVALIAVLANLPIEPWTQFLKNTGMYSTALEVVSLTLSLLAVYVVGAIGYAYTKKENDNVKETTSNAVEYIPVLEVVSLTLSVQLLR